MHIILLTKVPSSNNNLHICLFLDRGQTNYFKIGKFRLLMMYKIIM